MHVSVAHVGTVMKMNLNVEDKMLQQKVACCVSHHLG